MFAIFASVAPMLLLCGETMTLVRRGELPSCQIVLPENAAPAVHYAAQEFALYAEKATGVKLPIATNGMSVSGTAVVLEVCGRDGASPARGMPRFASPDAFRIVARPPNLHVIGASERGALYGTYELLERFADVRWYAPDCEVVPPRDEISVPTGLDETHAPAFEMRDAMWMDAYPGDFAARLRLNGNNTWLSAKHGGKPHRFSPKLRNCHTFETIVPVEEFFDSHPEYFSEVDGLRVKEKTQLCLTNPDVLRIATERVLADIAAHPDVRYFGVSQNDWHNPCTCVKCATIDREEGSYAGTLIRFVNAVAEAVERAGHGDKVIETLAYQYTRTPPTKTRCRRNVMPCLCSIECDFSRPLDKSPVLENKAFVRDLDGWAAICEKLYVWDYAVDYSHFLMPFPNLTAIRGNLRFFRGKGVSHVLEQGAWRSRGSDMAPLKVYLCAKWLWNPDLPPTPLIEGFLNAYYGGAAPCVREYIVRLHGLVSVDSTQKVGGYADYSASYLTDSFLADAAVLWEKAAAAVKGDAVLERRVRAAAMGVDYVKFRRQIAATGREWMVTRNPARFAPSAEAVALAAKLDRAAAEYGKSFLFMENRGRDAAIRKKLRECLDPSKAPKPCDKVTLLGRELRLADRAAGVVGVKDAQSTMVGGGAQVAKLYRSHAGRDARIPVRLVGYDADAAYRFRIHARIPLTCDVPQGEALRMGIWDNGTQRDVVSLALRGDEVADGYAWYDLPSCRLDDKQYFYVSPGSFDREKHKVNPTIECVFIDLVQIARAE